MEGATPKTVVPMEEPAEGKAAGKGGLLGWICQQWGRGGAKLARKGGVPPNHPRCAFVFVFCHANGQNAKMHAAVWAVSEVAVAP